MVRPDYTLRTLRKGLAVLEALENAPKGLTLTELGAELGESHTVVFRVLKTLEEAGYLCQDPSKRYNLGLRIWEMGCKAISRTGLAEIARPILRRLTDVTGETSVLAVARGTDVIYLDVVEGSEPLRVYAEPGFRAPLYATASGKAIMAHREAELLPRVVKDGMRRLTARTITRPTELRVRLAEIRNAGVSINRGERRDDISAVAAPLFDSRGECAGAVGVSGPSTRFEDERLETIKRYVRRASEEIS